MKKTTVQSENRKWTGIPTGEVLEETVKALKENGINSFIVESGEEAKKRVLEMIPKGSEVMTMISETLRVTEIADAINNSENYDSVRNKLNKMDRKTQSREMQRLGAAPEWVIGSVHGVTEDGKVFIASNTGSQLPAYVYGSDHVIWVVGAQKIVKDLDEAWKRLYEHTLPLESERLKKMYGVPSNVSKVLILQREVKPVRITLIFVKEVLGF